MKPTATLTGTRFVLAVKNLKKSGDYYEQKLGLSTIWKGDGWHFLERDQFIVMLGECPDDRSAFETVNHSYFGYIQVRHIDALHDEYKKKDVEILSGPSDEPWGQREFGIRTIDGHRIKFGQDINPTKSS